MKQLIFALCFIIGFHPILQALAELEHYCNDSELDSHSEAELLNLLLRDYSTEVRPKEATKDIYGLDNEPDQATVEVGINQLWGIDQVNQQYHVMGTVWTRWIDCRLTYKSKERNGTFGVIVVAVNTGRQIWTPLLHVQNARAFPLRHTCESCQQRTAAWFLHPDGEVLFRETINVVPGCTMDFTHMPFDKHKCDFVLESSEYTTNSVVYSVDSEREPVQLYKELTNSHWKIYEWDGKASNKTYDSGPVDLTYSRATISFELERKPYWYIMEALVPTGLYWLASYAGFYIPAAAAPARVAMHLLPVLIIVNQHNLVAGTIPRISYATWLSDYTLAILFLAVIHLCSYAFVSFCIVKMKDITAEKKKLHDQMIADGKEKTAITAAVEINMQPEVKHEEIEVMPKEEKLSVKFIQFGTNMDHWNRRIMLALYVIINVVYLIKKAVNVD